MATYRDLKAKAEELLAQAEEARLAELQQAIDQVRALVAEYGLTPEHVFGKKRTRANGAAPKSATAKYQDPRSGKTWSGRGREPSWIKGKNRERFLLEA
ncbi:H-NS histone family protein [Paraburkholderia sp. Ac-20347]|uniref:H-NS histone family protein n=1 Tax=Paraburkholderia sp. Ac-20347 TaxID=2703892 RepID=UPI001980175A|nr:H-NS histone family protein [Paraburkholderia sp. Ac-20347]MBN3807661.1 H-NS histone family protein [Paraburkholderia sp. Ac-20347]